MKKPRTMRQLLKACPFRTLLGEPEAPIRHTFAALGGTPSPIASDTISEIVGAIRSGQQRVLILADRRDLRDAAVRQVLGMLQPPAGSA